MITFSLMVMLVISFFSANAEDMRLTDAGALHVDNDVIAFSTTISDERLKKIT